MKNNEELKKYDIEVLFEKGKLIFKYKIDNEKNGKHFNYYFRNKDDIYKEIGLSFSKKSTVLFHEWKNRNEVIQKRTQGISITGNLDQKIERIIDKTAIEFKIGSERFVLKKICSYILKTLKLMNGFTIKQAK